MDAVWKSMLDPTEGFAQRGHEAQWGCRITLWEHLRIGGLGCGMCAGQEPAFLVGPCASQWPQDWIREMHSVENICCFPGCKAVKGFTQVG